MAALTRARHGLRRARVCSAPQRNQVYADCVNLSALLRRARDTRVPRPSLRARPLGELRTNLRLQETIAGSPSLFPACYLQGMLQPQRVSPPSRAQITSSVLSSVSP